MGRWVLYSETFVSFHRWLHLVSKRNFSLSVATAMCTQSTYEMVICSMQQSFTTQNVRSTLCLSRIFYEFGRLSPSKQHVCTLQRVRLPICRDSADSKHFLLCCHYSIITETGNSYQVIFQYLSIIISHKTQCSLITTMLLSAITETIILVSDAVFINDSWTQTQMANATCICIASSCNSCNLSVF